MFFFQTEQIDNIYPHYVQTLFYTAMFFGLAFGPLTVKV